MNGKRQIRAIAKKIFGILGKDVIDKETGNDYLPEYHIKKLFNNMNIESVIDVGANIGQYANNLREECGFEGNIYSFEPALDTYAKLKKATINDSKWWSFNSAIGESNTFVDLNITRDGKLCSILVPSEKSDAMIVEKIESVPSISMDEFTKTFEVKDNKWESRTHLKLDTQGYDHKILESNSNYVIKFPSLQTEIGVLKLYENVPSFHDTFRLLLNLGFYPTGIFPVSRDESLRVRDFDCFFVNGRFLNKCD